MPDLDDTVLVAEVQPARRQVLVQRGAAKRHRLPHPVHEEREQLAQLRIDDVAACTRRKPAGDVELERALEQLARIVKGCEVTVLLGLQRLKVGPGKARQPPSSAHDHRTVHQRHEELGRHLRRLTEPPVVLRHQVTTERDLIGVGRQPLMHPPANLVGPQAPLAIAERLQNVVPRLLAQHDLVRVLRLEGDALDTPAREVRPVALEPHHVGRDVTAEGYVVGKRHLRDCDLAHRLGTPR